jgi:hypothetical protein
MLAASGTMTDGLRGRLERATTASEHYAAAISRVALIGNLSTLHSADKFASRGRTWSVSQ